MRIGIAIGLAGLFLIRTAGTAFPKDLVEVPLAQAKKYAEANDVPNAAKSFGEALAGAQSGRALAAEQTVADALEAWMGKLEREAVAGKDAREPRPNVAIALAGVMKGLDAARSGAFVSAHALATEVLVEAVASGDDGRVADAAAVLAAHAKAGKSGKAGAMLAQWGEGMRLASVKDAERADAALEAAAKTAAANGWFTVAACAATELAALRWQAKAAANVSSALSIAAGMVGEGSDPEAVKAWVRMVSKRLEGVPEEALAEYTKATAAFGGGAGGGGAGGVGGAGGKGGGGGMSEVGTYLAKAPADKPFVTVMRGKEGFTPRLVFRKAPEEVQAFKAGQRYWDGGGVTLAFAGRAVALYMVDLVGTAGQPGEGRPSRVRAYYLLAERETFGVAKSGVVTITP